MQASADYYTPGSVKMVPWTAPDPVIERDVHAYVRRLLVQYARGSLTDETSWDFVCPKVGGSLTEYYQRTQQDLATRKTSVAETQSVISGLIDAVYHTSSVGLANDLLGTDSDADVPISSEPISLMCDRMLAYGVGCVFGRWDIRYATGDKPAPELPDPFAPLPACPPGMLQNAQGLPAAPEGVPADYPLRISWSGILVDDPDHPEDIVRRVREVLALLWGERAEAIEQEACEILGVKELRDYFAAPSRFFADHLKRYSKSRRQAPIYWPLSTRSGRYTVWLYYHRLNADTLYTVVNRYVTPKMEAVQEHAERLSARLAEATGREAAALGDEIGDLRTFLDELREFRAELLRVAELPYKPDLNDGVIINAAPLHRLFRLRKWAQDTAAVWAKLVAGEYDWAHLAYTIWPERVRRVCETDRSIAIAHGLEHLCTVQARPARSKRRPTPDEDEDVEE